MPDHNWFRETFVFPRTLAKGEVDLHIALVDPNTNAPRVKFAIKEIDKDDWHPMGRMDVV